MFGDGRPFMVMEFIEGKSLKRVIESEGPLPVPRVCSIIKQVAAALGAAHELGLDMAISHGYDGILCK